MKKLTSKKKYIILKFTGIIFDALFLFGTTALFVALNIDKLWNDIPTNGITSFSQWSTLILYRFFIYIAPALILSFFKFDKRYKYISRLIIWLNWTLFIYLFSNVVIKTLSLDLIWKISIFNSLDNVVLLLGYILTFFNKKKVEFDSTGAIIGEKL